MAPSVTSPQVVNVADLRLLAKRRLPRVAFDYIDGGADGEVTPIYILSTLSGTRLEEVKAASSGTCWYSSTCGVAATWRLLASRARRRQASRRSS